MTAFPFQRIAIVGLGLMGGSLALALRALGYTGVLQGAGGSAADLELAQAAQGPYGAVFDALCESPAQLPLGTVDLLILAVPPAALPAYFALAAEKLPSTATVTDLASVKANLVAQGEALLGARYLSSHPLIGAEQHGFAAAHAELYRDYRCVLCQGSVTDLEVDERLTQFWTALGAEVLHLDVATHDSALAATSHLPHLLAFAYLDLLGDEPDLALLAGGGLRDFSRIAASDPHLWTDILWQNRAAVRARLLRLQERLAQLDEALAGEDPAPVLTSLSRGKEARSRFRFPSS
ncbi:prephenate dehydrogenase/arogenate dehydrogenase family protein [Acidithiobacillus sp. AMEEHan]|uniref:prephenate dehydrogenase n=1 Tax=Acidithiobacillus sp. AMEEHan TaxID=2994951 RepID=UPI0027E50893|nr:prephenate dehydrogenase/arogenate dehydrogenase family protein [Acidithiobacillus sp. AMEEHan]